jgi:hypothetical protein
MCVAIWPDADMAEDVPELRSFVVAFRDTALDTHERTTVSEADVVETAASYFLRLS